jgi:predicted O-methyltransferase YrrM
LDPLLQHLQRGVSFDEEPPLSPLWGRLHKEQLNMGAGPGAAWRPVLAYIRSVRDRLASPPTFFPHPRNIVQAATLAVSASLVDGANGDGDFAPWRYAHTIRLLDYMAREYGDRLDPVALIEETFAAEGPLPSPDSVAWRELGRLPVELMELLEAGMELSQRRFPDDVAAYRLLLEAMRPAVLAHADVGAATIATPRLAGQLMWSRLSGEELQPRSLPSQIEITLATVGDAIALRDLAHVARCHFDQLREPVAASAEKLLRHVTERAHSEIPPAVVAFTAQAAALVGASQLAYELVEFAARDMSDNVSGLLRSASGSADPAPEVGLALLTALKLSVLGHEPTEDEIPWLDAWRTGVGALQEWSAADAHTNTLLHTALMGGQAHVTEEWPLLVRRGRRVGLSFPLLTWAVAEAAVPPPDQGERFIAHPDAAAGAETWALVVRLLEAISLQAGLPRRIVWPWPARAGATVRHDVDRVPLRRTLEPLLLAEAEHRLPATWCFAPGCFATPMRALLRQLGHEVAIRGERDDRISCDLKMLNSWLGGQVQGWTARGALSSASSRGSITWLRVAEAGLAWTDFGGELSVGYPDPAVTLDLDRGDPRVLEVDVFDVDADLGDYLDATGAAKPDSEDEIIRLAASIVRRRDHCCFRNNTDVGGETHIQLVGTFTDRLGTSVWWSTLGAAARRRRAVDAVKIALLSGAELELRAQEHLPAMQLLLPERSGTPCLARRDADPTARLRSGGESGLYALDLPADDPIRISWLPEEEAEQLPLAPITELCSCHAPMTGAEITAQLDHSGIRLPTETSFAEVLPLLERAATEVWRAGGNDPTAEPARSNIEYNSVSVPTRASAVARFLAAAYGEDSEGMRILDIGCGFGGIALWFLTAGRARAVTGYEPSASYVRALESVISELGLTGIAIEQRTFEELGAGDDVFDLAIMIDLFSDDRISLELERLLEVMVPGAFLLIRGRNRMFDRPPVRADMSYLPGLHLLPRDLGRKVAAVLGGETRTADLRLLSALDLTSALTRAGFTDLRLYTDPASNHATLHQRDFFFVGARAPR